MSDFMRKGDVRDFGRDVGAVVLDGDDAGVQGLLLAIRIKFALFTDSTRAPCNERKTSRERVTAGASGGRKGEKGGGKHRSKHFLV